MCRYTYACMYIHLSYHGDHRRLWLLCLEYLALLQAAIPWGEAFRASDAPAKSQAVTEFFGVAWKTANSCRCVATDWAILFHDFSLVGCGCLVSLKGHLRCHEQLRLTYKLCKVTSHQVERFGEVRSFGTSLASTSMPIQALVASMAACHCMIQVLSWCSYTERSWAAKAWT